MTRRWRAGAATVLAIVVPTVAHASTTWMTGVEFDAGSHVGTVADGDSVRLELDGVGTPDPAIAWWDPAWGQRRCIDVTNNEATPLDEYQILVDLDTETPIAGNRMNAAGDDIRAISADGATLLDYWIEGPIDDPATRIWVQTDTLPAGVSTFCIYYDNPAAGPLSDPLTPFTYDSPQDLYVAVSANQSGRDTAIVSYTAGNEVSDGTTSVTLAAGGTSTLPGATHTPATVISATGPLALRGTGSEVDTYVPIAFAGTTFVLPTTRNVNQVSIYSPFAEATVSISHSGSTTPVTVPVGTSVTTNADITANGDAAVVTSDVPVLVTHQASGNVDAFVAVPASDETLYGIRSTVHQTGFSQAATSIEVTESGGVSTTLTGNVGEQVRRTGGGNQGTGPAVRMEPNAGGGVAAIQQADSDGGESSSYWPESELNIMYRLATASEYVAIACPSQAAGSVDIDGTPTDCSGTGGAGFPGKARAIAGLGAGDLISSLNGEPFYIYAEDQASNDEANILGPKQARLTTLNPPTHVVGPEQSPYESAGTWTSAIVDTGCASYFDTVSWNPATQPAATALDLQFASAAGNLGPFDFVGPDGTAATAYTIAAGESLAGLHSGDQFFQVRARLSSSSGLATPWLDDLTLEWEGQGAIGGTVFADDDLDGTFGGPDLGLDGVDVTVWLDDGDGLFDSVTDTVVDTVPTTGGGMYAFDELRPGTYFVETDMTDLDAATLIGPTTAHPAGPIAIDDCGSATADLGWEFGGNLAVTVFSDADADGVEGIAESSIPAVAVDLWLDDGDGIFDRFTDTLVEVAADPTGTVAFGPLPVGTYFAEVADESEPNGHQSPASGDNPVGPLAIVAGADLDVAIGFVPDATITGDVIGQPGAAVLADVPVGLYLDDGDAVFSPLLDTALGSTGSSGAGTYSFDGLSAGSFWVVPTATPAGYLPAAPALVVVGPGEAVTHDVVFAATGLISGVVTDTAVPPNALAGVAVTVHLDDGDGAFDAVADDAVGTVATAADGGYAVADLAPGSYWVTVETPAGFLPAEPVAVELAESAIATRDLALEALGSITVTLVDSADPDAIVEGIVELWLVDGPDGPIRIARTSGASDAAFSDLRAGEYVVTVDVAAAGYLPVNLVEFTLDPGGVEALTVEVTAGLTFAGFVIADDDGVADPETQPLGGVSVSAYLDDGDGQFDPSTDSLAADTVTTGDGTFSIGGLEPGVYFLVAELEGFLAELTEIRAPNVAGPFTTSTDNIVFVANPIEFTLPETGLPFNAITTFATALVALGFGLYLVSRTRRGPRGFVVRAAVSGCHPR